MGDDPILTRARRGDRRALEELCHREWRPVYALLYAAVRDRAEAQDLTQEVFLRALGALGHFRAGEAPFRAFLKVIARNLLRDRWRGRRPSPVDLALIREVPSSDADLAEVSAAAAERAQLLLALGTLPDDYAWEPRSGRELGRLPLDGMLTGFWQTDRIVDGRPVGASLDPGIALSPDGRRIAVLSAQEDLLTLIDATDLRVLWTRPLAKQGSGLDWLGLGARSAAAKGETEGASRSLVFSADGRRLYASGSSTRLDDRGEPMIEPFGLRAIAADDHGGGRVVAAGFTHDIVNWLRVSPDGAALYVCVSPGGGAQPSFIMRRLDPVALTTLAERGFPAMPQLHFLAAP